MNTFRLVLLFIQCLVSLKVSQGASTDESAKPKTTVVNLFYSEDDISSTAHQIDNDEYLYESEDDLSGDYEVDYPRVGFSTQPKDSTVMLNTENRRTGKRKAKGKKDPCLRKKYRDYCIHGVCQYMKELDHPTCRCEAGYTGERCHSLSLPVGKEAEDYNQTTALAIMAVVLSLMCLTIIGILLAFRYHRKNDCDVESEEKIRLEAATV
ncbi:heparin-binding EGF-like growth factor b isoform X2 [Electrophorus electricus]|uniref:heparin-binding EGF-like growth factor b isoform X2 n=1 Tax=Electrophorus electricus TaxID=8005 RepID=UPI0015D044C7|nr:heparin-binding EGF-like growth factor b isoform X2 [Electrophorus electricus]